MLQILKFSLIFLASKLVGWSCTLVPSSWEPPVGAVELKMLYKAATQGPGGGDDAVQMTLLNAPEKYAAGVAKLLIESYVGTHDEEVGLYFAELVVGDPGVRSALETVSTRHNDPKTKGLIASILAITPRAAPGI